MSNYIWSYLQKHPKKTKRLLGINDEQLRQLIEQGKLLNQRKKEEIENTKIRIIQGGGGNYPTSAALSERSRTEEEQIILMLVYLRHNLSFQLLGLLFQVSESTAHNLFNYWTEIFAEELPASLLEQVKKFQEEMEKIQEELMNHELIVDGSEQVIERPSDYQVQKEYSCGKTKKTYF